MRKIILFGLLLVPFLEAQDVYRFFHEKVLKDIGLKDTLIFIDDTLLLKARHYKGYIVKEDGIYPLKHFTLEKDSIIKDMLVQAVLESLKVVARRQASEGLIPDIEIPLVPPKGFGFIGEGGKLSIDGEQDITIGGRTSYWTDELRSEMGAPSKFPRLEMDQKLRVRLTGTVGKKIKVTIDHDSEREVQLKNKIKLQYEGEEDEIVQLIEAGDTKLSLPTTYYTGFPAGGKSGLFGIKTQLKFGPLDVIAVATREQGETQSRTYRGGATVDSFTIEARDFIQNRFFSLGEEDSIVEIQVFLDDGIGTNNDTSGAIPGEAVFYWPSSEVVDTTIKHEGYFNLLNPGEDYRFYRGTNVVEIFSPLMSNHVLAVYYVTASGRIVGDVSSSSYIHLKLIRPRFNDFPQENITPHPLTHLDSLWTTLWNMSLKNVYDLQGRNISYNDLEIKIFKRKSGVDVDGENGKTYLVLLGLDRGIPDGRVEQGIQIGTKYYQILDLENGYLFFPSMFPFADTSLEEPDSSIYWKKILQPEDGTLYYIYVKHSERSNVIMLSPNILEGSEVVKCNGQILKRGTDYLIDYESGILTITNPQILQDPNANIEVSYDFAPFFSLKQKSLVGTRLEYNLSKDFHIGSTWLLRSESTLDERPRLGEEPTRNALGELDIYYKRKWMWLTNVLNLLPFVSSDSASEFKFKTEIARNFPNPNLKGYGYLDDMEAVKLSQDIPISRPRWIYGSVPKDTTGEDLDTLHLAKKIIWATPQNLFTMGDIYPNLPPEEANDRTSVLYIEVEPMIPGDPQSWVSLNTLISATGSDFTNLEFFEIWVKGDGMKLHLDLGYEIPEDAVWRRKDGKIVGYDDWIVEIDPTTGDTVRRKLIRDEDMNHNGILEASEDVGLDLVAGDDDAWTPGSEDDGNDDYVYSSDFSKIDGTEGNNRRDTEDLDNDLVLTENSNYFEITIDLDDTLHYKPQYVSPSGWRYYRIRIRDPEWVRSFGNPSWDNIKFARLWLSGFTRTDTLYIAKMEITGSKWRNYGIFTTDTLNPVDSTEYFNIGLVNNKETEDYSPPPGVRLKRTALGEEEREQSLALVYRLNNGHYAVAHRQLFSKQDLLDYSKICFFVKPRYERDAYPTVIMRLGKDTLNFYEIRHTIASNNWQEVIFSVDELTRFKKAVKDTAEDPDAYHFVGNMGYKGNPTFTDIQMYEVVLLNSTGEVVEGELWIDEFRLGSPRRKGGIAMRGEVQLKLANLFDISASYVNEEANFQKLTETTRHRITNRGYRLNITTKLHNFLPKEWGFTIPITYTRAKQTKIPKFFPGSDVILTSAQSEKMKESSFSQEVNISFKKSGSTKKLLKWFLDPSFLRGNYKESYSNTSTERRSYFHRDASFSYSNSPHLPPLRIHGIEFNYFPSSYGFSLSYSKDSTYVFSKTSSSITRTVTSYANGDFNLSYNPFKNLMFSYGQGRRYNLTLDRWKRLGREVGMNENISGSYSINLFGIVSPNLSYTAGYQESVNEDPSDTLGLRNFVSNSQTQVNFPVELPKLLRKIASLRDETKDTMLEEAGPLHPILLGLEKVSKYIQAPSLTYRISRNFNYFLMKDRPNIPFRWGFKLSPGVPSLDDARNTRNFSQNLDLSGGLSMRKLRISYGFNLQSTRVHTVQTKSKTRSMTFPDLGLTVYNLIPLIKGSGDLFKSLSFDLRFRKTSSKTVNEQGYRSEDSETTFKPSVKGKFKNGVGLEISLNLRRKNTLNVDISEIKSTEKNWDFDIKLSYSLRNPEGFTLPLFGKNVFKIRSELNTSMTLKLSSTDKTQAGLPVDKTSSYSFSLTSSYSFTRNISGSLNFNYSSRKNKLTSRTYKDIGLSATAVFKF